MIQWSCAGVPEKMHYILDDPLSITSRMPTCSSFLGGASTYIFPETWDMHDLLAKTAMIREEFIILAPFGGERGRLCAHNRILLGKESYLGFVVFLWFLRSICSTHGCKMCFLSQRVMELGMMVRSERKTAAVLQTSTSLEVCEGTLVMLAVCCGRVHVLSCSGFRNSDIFLCAFMLVNEASQPSHMKIIGGICGTSLS